MTARFQRCSSRFIRLFALGVAALSITNQSACRSAEPITKTLAPAPGSAAVAEGPRLPLGRGSHAGGDVGGRVVVAGGTSWNADSTRKSFLSDTIVYQDGQWVAGPSLPAPFAEGGFADDGSSLYLTGGLTAADQSSALVSRIRAVDGRLQVDSLPALPAPVSGCAAEISGGTLFVACGYRNGQPTTTLLSLDLSRPDSQWVERLSAPGPGRAYPALVASGPYLYLLGGLRGGDGSVHDRTLRDALRYDPASNQWTAIGQLPVAGYCWSSVPLGQDRVLLVGRADGEIHNEIRILNLQDLSAPIVGRTVIQATCAPLVPAGPGTWWFIGGEPDSQKHRTERVTVISVR